MLVSILAVKQKLFIVLRKFKWFIKKNFIEKRVKFNLELLLESASEDIMVFAWEMKPIEIEVDNVEVETPTRKLKSWNELSRRHKLRHCQPIVDIISKLAVKYNATAEEVCAFILKRVQNLNCSSSVDEKPGNQKKLPAVAALL